MSTASINTSSLPQLTDLVKKSFLSAPDEQLENVMLKSGLVRTEKMSANTGGVRRFSQAISRSPYAFMGSEGAPATQATYQYGYEKDLYVTKRDIAISVTLEMRTLGKDAQIIRELTNLGPSLYRDIDLELTHRAFTFAWSTSFSNTSGVTMDNTTGDGLAPISTTHTLTGSATTWSNQVPSNPAFSKGALTSAQKTAVENTYDNLGNKTALEYDTIVTTDDAQTVIAVKELINATADITSSNANTFNVYGKGSFKHVIAPRIATKIIGKSVATDTAKAKYWFLCSSSSQFLIYGEAMAPSMSTPRDGNNGEDASTANWNFYGRSIVGSCIPSPLGLIGSKGTGEA